jgi:hypothetical protein
MPKGHVGDLFGSRFEWKHGFFNGILVCQCAWYLGPGCIQSSIFFICVQILLILLAFVSYIFGVKGIFFFFR